MCSLKKYDSLRSVLTQYCACPINQCPDVKSFDFIVVNGVDSYIVISYVTSLSSLLLTEHFLYLCVNSSNILALVCIFVNNYSFMLMQLYRRRYSVYKLNNLFVWMECEFFYDCIMIQPHQK